MPLPVDNLTVDSSPDAISQAISQSIQACMNEPTPPGEDIPNKQKWCSGKAYGIARTKTGKNLGQEGQV